MTKVLLVLSSVREGRIADKILEQVRGRFEGKNVELDVADFKAAPLPFFDHAASPAAEDFSPTDENVQKWTRQVEAADTVVFLTSENNFSYSAVLKNAIDWINKEWADKPVAFIGYGWSGGSKAIAELRKLFTGFIQAKPLEAEANLAFTKSINLDGTALDEAAVVAEIDKVADAVVSQ